MTDWTPTFAVADLVEPRRFEAGGRAVLVAVVDGQPRAVADSCLHKGASLEGGVCKQGVITCPSHWWRYDLRDGALQGSPGVHLATFPCRVVDGTIEVDLPPAPAERSMRDILLEHARSSRPANA
ncbi:MAG: Rieske (2Fe-2S) protein [Actinomycetota bacterium]